MEVSLGAISFPTVQLPEIVLNDSFKKLVYEVRKVRADMAVCPSANFEVNVPELLKKIITENVYMEDYETITVYFQNCPLSYHEAISALEMIADSGMFA